MFSRAIYAGLFAATILTLLTCSINARRHYKSLGNEVAALDLAIIPPILGNVVIIMAQRKWLALLGCYIYFTGMDLIVFQLMKFTEAYCKSSEKAHKALKIFRYILLADVIQLLINPFTKHAFDVEWIVYDRQVFYVLKPLIGQAFHRVICYGFFIAAILIFAVTTVKTARIYRERYSVILITMILVGIWETYYIFSKNPIDRSMIGFGAFGILVYYFSIHYRPLRLLDRMLSGIVSNGEEACFIFTPRGRCVWVNQAAALLVGVQENNCEKASESLEYLFNTKLRKGNWTEQHVTGGGDSIKYYLFENRDVINENGKVTGYYLKVRDITEDQLRVRRELYEATHDRLTGLYTREHLFRIIRQTIDAHVDTDYLILYINIKSFKTINDIFGNDFGDFALKCYSDKIKSAFSKNCVYGRLESANFGVLIPKKEFDAGKVEKAIALINIKQGKARYPVQAQIGVYEVDRNEPDIAVMFANARISLSSLDANDSVRTAYYDEKLRNEILWNRQISTQLTDAIRNRDIKPFLQPIADLNGKIVGCEALVRWEHKEYGFLTPIKFIPSFEKNGLIAEVDKYMWRCACEILAEWKKQGRDLFISVNISPKDFYYFDVPKHIKGLIEEFGIEPRMLRVEITETVMMTDTDMIISIMEELRDYGFIVEMDDFGSGYSSLSMLKSIPVDVLKIDMNFLGRSGDIKKADTIVKNIINLSMDLGMTSLTEGVETQCQYDILAVMGCELFQGYYFSKPVPTDEFEKLVIVKNK
ncbi:MAG: EAL domain-containing protein [Saccharofermentans sp.]|nr:EAL domain-containing protein [Saccharofermentans sp.]